MSKETHAIAWLSLLCLGLVAILISLATSGTVSFAFLLAASACGLGVTVVTLVYWLQSGRNPYRGFPFMLFDESDQDGGSTNR